MAGDEAGSWPATSYDAWFDQPWGRYASRVEHAAVAAALGPLAARRVLDVGCGTGRLLAALAGAGGTGVGVDRSRAMLERARSVGRAPLVQADAGRLPIGAASVDAAVAVAVLEFVADPEATVLEMCRVTRPGGRVVVGILNQMSPWGVLHRRRFRRPPWNAATFFDRDRLRRLQALGRAQGTAQLRGVLFAPGPVPGLGRLGPLMELVGRLVPRVGAFQVLTIERRPPWT